MPKAPTRKEAEAKATPPPSDDRTPLDRMTELTRRIVSVPKDEALSLQKRARRQRKG